MSLLDALGSVVSDVTGFPGNLANPYGPASDGLWNLVEGSFTNDETGQTTTFYFVENDRPDKATSISQINDGGSRRLAIYKYPYRDGQLVDDLGRDGETHTFEIKFFGQNYQTRLKEFIEEIVNRRASGKLSHPVRGVIPCRFSSWNFVHRHDEWNAVSIQATFVENNLGSAALVNAPPASPNMVLRTALQVLTDAQAAISEGIFRVSALLLLPDAIKASLKARADSLFGQVSRLLGQLAITFASDAHLRDLALRAQNEVNGFAGLDAGTTTSPSGQPVTLPPVFQVGFTPADQQTMASQAAAFERAARVTPQQAVYSANQIRAGISTAIAEVREQLGNDGYEVELAYRGMAVQIQQAVESSISAATPAVIIFRVPSPMSLRMVAFLNGLSKDRQNDIEQLNPYLESVNWIREGTEIVVPAT
jgi:prophage DNA circulation protein